MACTRLDCHIVKKHLLKQGGACLAFQSSRLKPDAIMYNYRIAHLLLAESLGLSP